MRMVLLIIFVCLHSSMAQAEFKYPEIAKSGETIQRFIPQGWKIHKPIYGGDIVRGDLNKDGIEDAVLVLQHLNKVAEEKFCGDSYESPEDHPRILVILSGQKGGGYRLSAQDNRLLFRSQEGGMMGDPLESLKIERGTLVIEYYGGSAWRWRITQRYRLENTGWFLIGYTRLDHWTGDPKSSLTEDFNLNTGKIEVKKETRISEVKKYIVQRKQAPVKLEDVRCWKYKSVDELKVE